MAEYNHKQKISSFFAGLYFVEVETWIQYLPVVQLVLSYTEEKDGFMQAFWLRSRSFWTWNDDYSRNAI